MKQLNRKLIVCSNSIFLLLRLEGDSTQALKGSCYGDFEVARIHSAFGQIRYAIDIYLHTLSRVPPSRDKSIWNDVDLNRTTLYGVVSFGSGRGWFGEDDTTIMHIFVKSCSRTAGPNYYILK